VCISAGSFLHNVMELGEAGSSLELTISCLPIVLPGEGGGKEDEDEDEDESDDDDEEGGFACPCTKVGGRSRMHSSSAMATEYGSCEHKEYSNLRFTVHGPARKSPLTPPGAPSVCSRASDINLSTLFDTINMGILA
jgi:hypothetical protein